MSETEQLQLIPEDDAFLIERSIDRYCESLSSLRSQLTRHSAGVNELLTAPPKEERPQSRSESRASDSDELRKLERQARVERLRKNGWQRKRFDARRYEELCETVLSELA